MIRRFVPGATVFLTVVTAGRRPILTQAAAPALLGAAMRQARSRRYFDTVAMVLLPDHFHLLMGLPPGDAAYPQRVSAIKQGFTRAWLAAGNAEATVPDAQVAEGRRGVWQRRFMEHTLRDVDDFRQHFGYTLFNPVKHGLADRPVDWPHSTLHRDVRAGRLPPSFGTTARERRMYRSRLGPDAASDIAGPRP